MNICLFFLNSSFDAYISGQTRVTLNYDRVRNISEQKTYNYNNEELEQA